MAEFFNARALESARSSHFKSTSNALAELVDNSFDAEASIVRIFFVEHIENGGRHPVREIIVADDGVGMPYDILQDCLTFGGGVNTDSSQIVKNRKLGKFGFGLPSSSLSQCPHTVVYSWQNSGDIFCIPLNLKNALEKNSIEAPKPTPVTNEIPKLFGDLKPIINKKHGTIVHWKECDRLSHKHASTLMKHGQTLLGRLYRYLIKAGKRIEFRSFRYDNNGYSATEISPIQVRTNDPLFLTGNSIVASEVWRQAKEHNNELVRKKTEPFVIDEENCKPTSEKLDDYCSTLEFFWKGETYSFEILVSLAHPDIQKPGVREGGATFVGKAYGKKEEEGSISFVRSDREISTGRYGLYTGTDETNRWWSIEVRFLPDADDLMGVSNDKQDVAFRKTKRDLTGDKADLGYEFNEYESDLLEARDELWFKLTKKLDEKIRAARKLVGKITGEFKNTTTNKSEGAILDEQTPETTATTVGVDGKRKGKLKSSEKKLIVERLSQKYPKIDEATIAKAVQRFDEMKIRGVLLYAADENSTLWSFTPVGNFLIIIVNTNHEFYTNIISPLRDGDQSNALAALELFISSLAFDEYNQFYEDDRSRDTLESYREYVGLHLKRYIRENNLSLAAGVLT